MVDKKGKNVALEMSALKDAGADPIMKWAFGSLFLQSQPAING
jgi:hypothetical protein